MTFTTPITTAASYTMTNEAGTTYHYPKCNERCVGDSHWLDNTEPIPEDDPNVIDEPTTEETA